MTFLTIVAFLGIGYLALHWWGKYNSARYLIEEAKRSRKKRKLLQKFKEGVNESGNANKFGNYITSVKPKKLLFEFYNDENKEKLIDKLSKTDAWLMFYKKTLVVLGGTWYNYSRPFDDTSLILDISDPVSYILVEKIEKVTETYKDSDVIFEIETTTADNEFLILTITESNSEVLHSIRTAFEKQDITIKKKNPPA